MRARAWIAGAAGAVVLACTHAPDEVRQQDQAQLVADTAHPWRKPGDKIDSILPMPEYLRRFRQGLAEPAALAGGEASRVALARRFLAGVAARDSAGLAALLVSRAEFAWLLFPHHLYALPPYELDPEIFWLQLSGESRKGFSRVLQRYGGKPLRLLALSCQRDTLQITSGPIAVWSPCRVRFATGEGSETRRLFGSLVERDGQVKLLSFANEF